MKSSKEEERSFGALYFGEEHTLYKKGDTRVCESQNRFEEKSERICLGKRIMI